MRLGKDVWIAAEALARHYSTNNRRDALEKAIFEFVNQKIKSDKAFSDVWTQVKQETMKDD